MLNYSLQPSMSTLWSPQAYPIIDQNMLLMLQLQAQHRQQLEKSYFSALMKNNQRLWDSQGIKQPLGAYKASADLFQQPLSISRESSLTGIRSEPLFNATHQALACKTLEQDHGLRALPREASSLKTQILHLLSSVLKNYKKVSKDELLRLRSQYAYSPVLQTIFDLVLQKYSSSSKCREDMMRFVFRKAISYLRDSLREKDKLSAKAASLALCQKYFNLNSQDLAEQIDIQDEDQILAFLLPYKKNSRNKTANSSFITEMFTSEVFQQDYVAYLENLDQILNDDNQKKIEKFVDFLEECATKNTLHKVKNYKRLPWLEAWLDSTKSIAHELLNTTLLKKGAKKLKHI